MCLLERFIPSDFPSHPQLLGVNVVEGNDVPADVVRKRILVVRFLLRWNGSYLQTCVSLVTLDFCLFIYTNVSHVHDL